MIDRTIQQTMQSLFKEFEDLIPLTPEEAASIEQKIMKVKVKCKAFLLKEGNVCKAYTFVVKGCFKKYCIDDKGFTHNIQFASEGDFIADIGSFYTQTPSKLQIYLQRKPRRAYVD